ncbi:MAG TPA: ribonucleotide reductase N-terminal alpha domain-containing protein, partial [Candidatus Paceibacterota bacterium]|nr:ribonucleotide reductase N-terminal alpha domain-containing protein [Candidatus Paceibacterota bacterium]
MLKEKVFSYEQAMKSCLEYFNNNDLAATIFLDKYALKNIEGKLIEETPDDTHKRLAKEFARIEKSKFKNPLTENEIFKYLEGFKKIIPQGSPMFGIGNKYQYVSISNCFVLPSAVDSYGGILFTDEQLVQVSKRRGGVGHDVSNLRPINTPTKN